MTGRPICDPDVRDRAQVVALGAVGVVTREVPHPRLVDGYAPSQRTRAVEALLRHHDPRVVAAVVEALAATRGPA